MMKDLQAVWVMTKLFTLRYMRDKVAVFFTLIFPLMFLVIFGFIFGGNDAPSFKVALINNSETEFSRTFIEEAQKDEVFQFTETDFDDAKEKLGRGEFSAVIELPETFGELDAQQRPSGTLVTYYDPSDEQLAASFQTILQGMLDGINAQFVQTDKPLVLDAQPIQTANLTRFDYLLAGLIGFSILGLGIFSMSEGFTADKKTGALRRLRVAPIRAWQLIVATALNRIFMGIISVAFLFTCALLFFDFNMRGDYLSFTLFTIIGTACIFGFGMVIAGWARDANQAAPLTQMVTLPMMFLSGVFFPTFLMPEWLQSITQFIPLTPVIDGLRLILTEGRTLLDLGPQLAVIGGWTLIMYFIAFKIFRWE